MMRIRHMLFSVSFAILIFICASPTFGQVAIGTPPFGSFGGGPDVMNLGNLNAHLTIPVLQKNGRGTPFAYDLSYDSSIWEPVTSNGTTSWKNMTDTTWGWTTSIPRGGHVSYSMTISTQVCYVGRIQRNEYTTTYYNWKYYDGLGTPHPIPGSSFRQTGCTSDSGGFTSTASDGSGYTVTINGANVTSLTARDGAIINPYTAGVTLEDKNGNEITASGGSYYDNLSSTTPVLTVAGSGTPTSPMTFTYTAPSGANAAYTMKYTSYTVQTNFGCSGVIEFAATSESLVSEVDLPDGTKYTFTYEPTPGNPSNTTGRIASVTLPTGGAISYTYTGGSNGIECGDGSTAGLTRVTPDGTWKYARSGSGSAWTTTITDPSSAANQTVIDFQEESTNNNFYETERQVYSGSSSSGTLLKTVYTCYNGSTSPCNSTAITLPITQRMAILQWPGTNALQSKTNTFYNSYGSVTETDEYAYGAGAPGAIVRKTLTTYASLGNGIVAMPASVTVEDGSNNVKAQTTFDYDQGSVTTTSGTPQHISISGSRGNATTVSYLVGSTSLTKTFSYYDTGTMNTTTDVNGAVTTYNYGSGSCGNSFVTSVSEPLSLSRSLTWNCTGGVKTSLVDENGRTVTSSYATDPDFWRPNSTTDQISNTTGVTFSGQTSAEASLLFNGSTSTTDVLTNLDALGRGHVSQRREGPSSSTYDSVETDYDSLGRPNRTTIPYAGTAGQTNSSAPGTTTTYDALGRTTQRTDSGGKSVTYSYSQNDTYITIGPAPSGENTKRKQFEYDALGRLTSVCEVTSATGSGSCAQTSAVTGYWTKYTFDVMNHLTGVTQNAQSTGSQQTRAYVFDDLGRMTSETNPESGTTSYVFDSDTTCGTSKGDLVKKVDPAGNVICYAYDALHRPTSVIVSSGPYQSSTPNKYLVYDSATVNGVVMVNTKARMAEAYTCTTCPGSKITDVGISYTARGEPSDVYQSTPHSSGYYHVTQTYWANGAPNVLSNLVGLPTITYNVDGEGRVYSATAASGQNPLSSTTYNVASQPTQVSLGSSDSDAFTYDPNTNRMTQYQFTVNGQSVVGALTWNAIGTLETLAITDPFNSADAQTCSYTHDDLIRIASANCGSVWSQTFSYDAFGNLSKSGTISFQPTYSTATNHMTQIGSSTPTYDANGNVTNDFLHTYAWDAASRPVAIDGVGVTYDALGRMVEQNRSGAYSEIVYAPSGAKLALMSGHTLTKAFVALTGGAMAVYNSSGLAYYRHSDHLGSSRFASTPSRAMYFDGAYAPFGEPYAQTGTTDLSFTGMNQDTVANLYDFPAREYGTQGRWPSPDPSGLASVSLSDPQTLNRYAYVVNNPLTHTDPSGLHANDCWWYGTCMAGGGNIPSGVGGGGGGGGGDINPFGGDCGIDGCSNPSIWLPSSAMNSKSMDPNSGDCGMCVYLNDAGTGVTVSSGMSSPPQSFGQIDPHSNAGECQSNGGVFVNEGTNYGLQSQITVYTDPNSDQILISSIGDNGDLYQTWAQQPGQASVTTDLSGNFGFSSIKQGGLWQTANWKLGYSSILAFAACWGQNASDDGVMSGGDIMLSQMCNITTGYVFVPPDQ